MNLPLSSITLSVFVASGLFGRSAPTVDQGSVEEGLEIQEEAWEP
jgi:hypothetical protein